MRSVFRSVLVALLAALALGAVAASGASAHEFYIEGKSMKELGLKEEAISGKGSTSALLTANAIQITCASVSGSGTIKEGGTGTATVTLASCSVQKPANCTIGEPIVFETPSSLVEVESKLADEFTPFQSTFGLIWHPVAGQTCALGEMQGAGQITGLVASEAEQESGTLSFSAVSGSALEIGGFPWVLKLKENIKLSGANAGKKWSAKK